MPYELCPACRGKGKISKRVPFTSDVMTTVREECELCDGQGYIYEDATPQIAGRLENIEGKIEEILNILRGGKQ